MDGLKTDLLEYLNRKLNAHDRVIRSSVQKAHDKAAMDMVTYLRQQAKDKNIASMLYDERLILTHSLQFDANSKEEKSSLNSAIAQLDESRQCFDSLLSNPAAYNEMQTTYPTKKKEAGLPLDAARDFFKSHSTRLSNILSGKSSHFEKVLVRQRKDNLQVIRDAYVELQRKALGMEAPKKDKGLSR